MKQNPYDPPIAPEKRPLPEGARVRRPWLRRLVLAYRPYSRLVWAFHGLFYLGLATCLFLVVAWTLIWIAEGPSTFADPPHIVLLQMSGMQAAFLLLLYGLVWVPAVLLDKRAAAKSMTETEAQAAAANQDHEQ